MFAFPTADHLGAHEPSSDPRQDCDPGSQAAGTRTEAKTGAGRGEGANRPPAADRLHGRPARQHGRRIEIAPEAEFC